jgi:hypothetical protein
MKHDPITQIKDLAAHTVSTYGSVGDQSYVTGHAAAMDAREILAVIDSMIFMELYQCEVCEEYSEGGEICPHCDEDSLIKIQAISKRRRRGARK